MTGTVQSAGMARRFWLAGGACCTAIALIAGCLMVWGWLTREVQTERTSYAHRTTRIVLEATDADVTFTTGPADQVTVDRRLDWAFSKPSISEHWDGDTWRVRADCGGWLPAYCSVAYSVQVPPGVSIEVNSKSGDVSVSDVTGDLRLSSSSGDIDIVNAAGRLRAQTTSGNIRATGLRSAGLDAKATSGNITAEFSAPPGQVSVKTSSGNAEVAVPTTAKYSVHPETTSGNQEVTVSSDLAADRRIDVRCTSGNLQVRYAAPGP